MRLLGHFVPRNDGENVRFNDIYIHPRPALSLQGEGEERFILTLVLLQGRGKYGLPPVREEHKERKNNKIFFLNFDFHYSDFFDCRMNNENPFTVVFRVDWEYKKTLFKPSICKAGSI